ncbi:LysR family regulator CbbR [Acidimangrovimonas sediminis]|uniref:LysR family regulator CbbR n=1 Tax=Acidimangrovimonas sediminis TaxID=2056283 RepID=UPI000C7FE545|nr:LysR family transcriptional regulator [Acidimangrovimonas sediminis]
MRGLDAITLKQLRALYAVARTGSITAAAESLRLTPPAVHSQIKGLEGIVEATLLHRATDSAGSQLTAEGQALLRAAERIEAVLSQGLSQVRALSDGHAGRVTLGVVSTGKYFAPSLVKRLKESLPGIEIVLRVGNRTEVIADLERGAVDMAIMGRPPRHPVVVAEPLGSHPHGIVAAPDHPLAGKPTVAAEALMSETFLAREDGSGTRILMARYLDRIGEGQIVEMVEMGTNETIKQAVIAGLGIAFLSLHTVMDELRFGRLVQLNAPGLPILRQWFLVWPDDAPLGPAAERVHQAIVALRGGFLPGTSAS